MRALAPWQGAFCASDVHRHVSPCIWLARRRTASPQRPRARRGGLVIAAVVAASLSSDDKDDDAKKSSAGAPSTASTSSRGGQAASVARRRAAVSRSRQQQQQKQQKQLQGRQKQEETTTSKSSTSDRSGNKLAPPLKATATQKKRQRANATALGAAARNNAPEKDGYKKLTPEDEARLCADIKELRRLETFEPPVHPETTRSQHAAAWAEAASVPSAAELARRVAAGRDSERRLLEAHAGLAHALASAATPLGIRSGRRASMRSVQGAAGGAQAASGLEHGDCLGEARAALLRAAAAYDPSRGSSLSSLAALAGRRSLGDYAAAHGRVVAAPKSARYAVAAMAKARRALILEREERRVAGGAAGEKQQHQEQQQPTLEEVAKAAGGEALF